MSANHQRLKSAIRAIALTPEERRALLGESSNKGGKASSAGVGTSEAEESRLCCDGSTSSNANPGTSERDPDSDDAGQGGLDPDDPAKLSSGDGTLSGVVDCATGEPVCFDGSGFIPPDGWDEVDDPPVDPTYEPGKFWANGDGSSLDCCTASPTEAGAEALIGPCDSGTFAVSVRQYNCVGSGTAYSSYCGGADPSICDPDPEDILVNGGKWPSDGCVNLAVKGGAIVGSKYDPENGGAYSKPMSEINLCDGNGNQITLAPSADGGWKTIDAINGGDGYLYDSQGKQIARISGDEFSDPAI